MGSFAQFQKFVKSAFRQTVPVPTISIECVSVFRKCKISVERICVSIFYSSNVCCLHALEKWGRVRPPIRPTTRTHKERQRRNDKTNRFSPDGAKSADVLTHHNHAISGCPFSIGFPNANLVAALTGILNRICDVVSTHRFAKSSNFLLWSRDWFARATIFALRKSNHATFSREENRPHERKSNRNNCQHVFMANGRQFFAEWILRCSIVRGCLQYVTVFNVHLRI